MGPATVRYEVAAEIFLATVRAARTHREFSMLQPAEQDGILRRGWAAAFALRAAIWPIDLSAFRSRPGSAYDPLAAARSSIGKLRPDPTEMSTLETLVLCRPGKVARRERYRKCRQFSETVPLSPGNLEIAETATAIRLTGRATDAALEALVRHLNERAVEPCSSRLLKIMLVLPTLTACCPRDLAGELFAPIIADEDLERVIESVR
ncbi:nuclear hormone receptor 83 [Nomia melanderi]|uniref:nuclear hormone receptor 83 n=1 Tax=Nomia melanderi TaxID=2448451 RepID=UPI003FCC3B8B